MANKSIFDAFERMWQHTVAKLGLKADKVEIQETYETKAAAGDKLAEAKEYAASEVNALAGQIAYIDTEDNEDVNDTEKSCVKTINGIEPDGNGNIEIEVGGVTSWNDLTDKPFEDNSENVNLVFTLDHSQTYETFNFGTERYPVMYSKVSDEIFNIVKGISCQIKVSNSANSDGIVTGEYEWTGIFDQPYISYSNTFYGYILTEPYQNSSTKEWATAGVWLRNEPHRWVDSVSFNYGSINIKTLDNTFLPFGTLIFEGEITRNDNGEENITNINKMFFDGKEITMKNSYESDTSFSTAIGSFDFDKITYKIKNGFILVLMKQNIDDGYDKFTVQKLNTGTVVSSSGSSLSISGQLSSEKRFFINCE